MLTSDHSNPRGALTDEQKKLIKDTLTVPYEKMTHREEFEDYYRNTLAPFLLNGVELVANGQSFLIKEVEFYFTCDAHPDPFTHCQTIQESCAVWYFHRTGNSYKSGCANSSSFYPLRVVGNILMGILVELTRDWMLPLVVAHKHQEAFSSAHWSVCRRARSFVDRAILWIIC